MFNQTLPFRKMNGLGNDFAVIDARMSSVSLSSDATRRLADRHSGVGCDQVIVIETSQRGDAFMRILNADGSEVGACGNATRCVAALLSDELRRPEVVIETAAGLLASQVRANGSVTVDMGMPRFGWRDIPLARDAGDASAIDYRIETPAGVLEGPSVANVGNPHCIFWVEDLGAYDAATIGKAVENDPLFPERVNVSFAQVLSQNAVRLRVWERGVGLTQACGSAACATGVAAARRGLTARKVDIELPGGVLGIEWRETDGHILMTGPWSLDYEGIFDFGEAAPAA
jgi:diaminopimelate epimerase